MPELRKDPVIGRWVIISTERAKRPEHFASRETFLPQEGDCPFCEGHEAETPPEIYALRPHGAPANSPGWQLRVVSSISPFLRVEGNLERRGKGLYDLMNGIGAHERIIETSRHVANMADLPKEQISRVISAYIDRINDLEKDKRLKYVLVFKNHGWSAGAGNINHTRSQLIATPVNPKRVKEELSGARQYYEYHERCIFCDIVSQETESNSRVILDENGFLVVTPFAARFPFEVWILPRRHSPDFTSLQENEREALAGVLKKTLSKIKKGLNDPAYNYVIHTAPFRRQKTGYWRTIDNDYHWHIEIMPRLTRIAGFEWGTGFYICPISPEDCAAFLREVEV